MMMKKYRMHAPLRRELEQHALWLSSRFQQGRRADFSRRDLSNVDLTGLDLSGAYFMNADLQGARLIDTIFHGGKLRGAQFATSIMFDTVFRRVDLSQVIGLEAVIHHGPSTIGLDTVLRSRGRIPPAFLRGAGMPQRSIPPLLKWAATYGHWARLQSVFISYGGPDEGFAHRLYDALRRSRVHAFFFPVHASLGEKLYKVMSDGVNEYDRVVLLCSRESLSRAGVLNEIEETLQREAREGGSAILLPLALDDYIFSNWCPQRPAIARALRGRVIGDFRGAQDNPAVFRAGLERVLKMLDPPSPRKKACR